MFFNLLKKRCVNHADFSWHCIRRWKSNCCFVDVIFFCSFFLRQKRISLFTTYFEIHWSILKNTLVKIYVLIKQKNLLFNWLFQTRIGFFLFLFFFFFLLNTWTVKVDNLRCVLSHFELSNLNCLKLLL